MWRSTLSKGTTQSARRNCSAALLALVAVQTASAGPAISSDIPNLTVGHTIQIQCFGPLRNTEMPACKESILYVCNSLLPIESELSLRAKQMRVKLMEELDAGMSASDFLKGTNEYAALVDIIASLSAILFKHNCYILPETHTPKD